MSFGSIWPADMITTIRLLWHGKSDFRNEGPLVDLIYLSMAIKSGPPYAHTALTHVKFRQIPCSGWNVAPEYAKHMFVGLHCRRRRYQNPAVWPSHSRLTISGG